MKISAFVNSQPDQHHTRVQTNDSARELTIPPKPMGHGSAVNGGELLMLALATCFCNDLYREAGKRNMVLTQVDVIVTGDFGAEGEAGTNFQYEAHVVSDAPANVIEELIAYTDSVAEVHNTLRKGTAVTRISSKDN